MVCENELPVSNLRLRFEYFCYIKYVEISIDKNINYYFEKSFKGNNTTSLWYILHFYMSIGQFYIGF